MQRYQEMLDDLRAVGSHVTTVKAKDVPIGALWVGKGFVRARKVVTVETAADYDLSTPTGVSIGYKDENQVVHWLHRIPLDQEIEVEVPIQS